MKKIGFVFAADGLKAYFMELGAGKMGSFGWLTATFTPRESTGVLVGRLAATGGLGNWVRLLFFHILNSMISAILA